MRNTAIGSALFVFQNQNKSFFYTRAGLDRNQYVNENKYIYSLNGPAYFWRAKHKQYIVTYLYFYVPWVEKRWASGYHNGQRWFPCSHFSQTPTCSILPFSQRYLRKKNCGWICAQGHSLHSRVLKRWI